jgi:hypothetical protein
VFSGGNGKKISVRAADDGEPIPLVPLYSATDVIRRATSGMMLW